MAALFRTGTTAAEIARGLSWFNSELTSALGAGPAFVGVAWAGYGHYCYSYSSKKKPGDAIAKPGAFNFLYPPLSFDN